MTQESRGRGGGRVIRSILLLSSVLLAFWLRAVPWRNFLDGNGQYLFYGPDSYDHLRRITLGLAGFPRVPTFDAFYGYPVGTGQIWSPLFDYLISIVTLLLGGGRPDGALVHAVGFWLSPVLGAATLFLLYRTGSLLMGKRAGVVACAVLALLPGHILYTFASELDHHVAEPMVCLLIMNAYLRDRSAALQSGRHTLPWRGAIALVFAILVWRGAIIFWGALFLAILVQLVAERRGRATTGLADYAWQQALLAAAMTLPLCLFNVWGSSGGVSFGIVSWFHVAFLVAWAFLFVLFRLRRTAGGGGIVVASPLLLLAAALLLLPAGRRFATELLSGLVVVGRGDPWLDSISELRSMLFPQDGFNPWHSAETLSLVYWLFPVLLWTLFRRWRQGGYADLRQSLFLVWGALFWLLPLFRERYVHLTAVVVALGCGYLVDYLLERLQGKYRERAASFAAGGALLLLLTPTLGFLWQLPGVGLPQKERSDLPHALTWLREQTPVPTGFMQPLKRPEYGVLADWGLGAYIDYVAQRPTVATNFGWETHGLFESAAFLTTSDPTAAARIIKDNRVRYLLLSDVTAHLPNLRAIAEFGLGTGRSPLATLPPFKPLASMYYRLYIQDGAAFQLQDVAVEAVGSYRLVYESPGVFFDPMVGPVSNYKIFACLPGALLSGRAAPGEVVELRIGMKSSSGRRFIYRDWSRADDGGRYVFRVPYPTEPGAGDVSATEMYHVMVGGRELRYEVSERDVQTGTQGRLAARQGKE